MSPRVRKARQHAADQETKGWHVPALPKRPGARCQACDGSGSAIVGNDDGWRYETCGDCGGNGVYPAVAS